MVKCTSGHIGSWWSDEFTRASREAQFAKMNPSKPPPAAPAVGIHNGTYEFHREFECEDKDKYTRNQFHAVVDGAGPLPHSPPRKSQMNILPLKEGLSLLTAINNQPVRGDRGPDHRIPETQYTCPSYGGWEERPTCSPIIVRQSDEGSADLMRSSP